MLYTAYNTKLQLEESGKYTGILDIPSSILYTAWARHCNK